jgi:hypothetical protein
MGLFNIGGSKQSSSSVSTEDSYGYQGSQSSSLAQALSRSRAGGQSTSGQSIAFSDLFAQLYGNASGAAATMATAAPGFAEDARALFTGGSQFLQGLAGGPETEYLESRVSGGNPLLDEQIGALGDDVSEFLNEDVLPGITSQGVAAGTLGGARNQLARSTAGRDALRTFTRGASDLRSQDMLQRDQAAQALQSGRIASAGTAFSGLPALFGVAEGGFNAGLAPYESLAGILGGPTTLTSSQATDFSEATSEEIAQELSRAFGEDFSRSRSSSSSKGKSFSLGF